MHRRLRPRRAAGFGGDLFATLVTTSVLVVLIGLQVKLPNVTNLQGALILAAQNGARTAAITDANASDVQQTVAQTLSDENVPITGTNGQTLFQVSQSVQTSPQGVPLDTVTVSYSEPPILPNAFAVLGGNPGGQPPAPVTLTATESAASESYWGGGS